MSTTIAVRDVRKLYGEKAALNWNFRFGFLASFQHTPRGTRVTALQQAPPGPGAYRDADLRPLRVVLWLRHSRRGSAAPKRQLDTTS